MRLLMAALASCGRVIYSVWPRCIPIPSSAGGRVALSVSRPLQMRLLWAPGGRCPPEMLFSFPLGQSLIVELLDCEVVLFF